MFSKDKNQTKITKTFSSVDNTRYKKVLQKKQRLYAKLLKTRTAKSAAEYKTYRNMFETMKCKAKRNYYLQKILKYKNNAKKHGYYGGNKQNK